MSPAFEIHTLRFGDADWIGRCAPTLDAYAARHGVNLVVWDDSDRGYPCAKFCEIDMIEAFIKGNADFFIYVDADVLVHKDAPLPDFLGPGIWMHSDMWHAHHQDHWEDWCLDKFGKKPVTPYSNAGVWMCDRESAKVLLAQMKPPFHEMFQEQHQFNWWVSEAVVKGVVLHSLTAIWNSFGRYGNPAWFHHFWGLSKEAEIQTLREFGTLDAVPGNLIHCIGPTNPSADGKFVTISIGERQGLGNQMFEIAGSLAIARELGIALRWTWVSGNKRDFGLHYFGLAETKPRPKEPDCPVVDQGCKAGWEANLEFVRNFPERECVIWSRFQSEECFLPVADEVKRLFVLPQVQLPHPPGATPVALHVRRGDYVNHLRLWVTAPEYFQRAVDYMKKHVHNPHFIVVSDDPRWCKATFKTQEFTVMPPQEPIEAMATIAACDAHIISNSTFGWWGAWLGEKGPVVVPSKWFTQMAKYHEWNPTPERWVGIDPSGPRLFRGIPPQNKSHRNLVVPRSWKKKA